MAEMQDEISQMRAITISREYGSGGGEIAKRLAARLGWQLIDHEIVARIAQELKISQAESEAQDERVENNIIYLLNRMNVLQPAMFAITPMPQLTDPVIYREALNKIVEGAAAKGHVVIVGRGAQVVLAQRRDVLHARIVAPTEQRIAYVMQRERLKRDEAQTRIQLKDNDRARYLQTHYHRHPADPHLYDITVNTGILDLESAVDIIHLALERKARRFSLPTGKLGPAVGLPPYPDQPEDLRPPETPVEKHNQ